MGLNNGIPQCSVSDVVIIEYAKMDVQLGRKPMNVLYNWIPSQEELKNKDLLSAFRISLKIKKIKDHFTCYFSYVYFFPNLVFF